MKIPILISLVMWWLAAPVRGAGVDIAWDGCLGDPEAVSFKSYDCQSAGQDQLLVSFVPAVSFSSVFLMEVAIELSTQSGAAMPAWWDVYGFNSCRRDGFVVDAYPPVVATPACEPWYLGSTLETNYDWRYPTADVARLVIQGRVSSAAVIEGHRYLACRLLLNLGGPAGCAGCLEPIDITVSAVRLVNSPAVDQVLTQPESNNVAHWQADRPTATRATSWAALKSLYR